MIRFFHICLIGVLSSLTALAATGKKISDYTETLELGEGWMYEIAVPGVTNYKVTFGTMATNIIDRAGFTAATSNSVIATVVSLNTNKADNNNGQVTNLTSRGLTLPSLTAGRPLILNASGNATNASGTPDGFKYLRDDGTLAVPSGSGGPGSLAANSGQFSTNSQLTIKDGASMSNVVLKGLSYISGIITEAGTNTNAFYGSNYFGGAVQIAVGSPGAGKVLTSDAFGNATWGASGGGGDVSTAQLNTASNFLYTTETTRNGAVSNAVVAFELTRNAAVSNALVALIGSSGGGDVMTAELNTASNFLYTTETTRNAAVSNALVTLVASAGSTQMVAAAIGTLTVTNTLSVGTLNANTLVLTNFLTSNQVRLGVQQLTNVALAGLQAGQSMVWNSSADKWTNANLMAANVVSNITATATNDLLLDFSMANIFKIRLLTNFSYRFTNAAYLLNKGYVYFQQDAVGVRLLNTFLVEGGVLQTNANMQPTTNALALDLLEVMPGLLTTNLIVWWPQNFQPRVDFPGSAVATLTDNFDRPASDPMSTTASGGGTWTSGPGSAGDALIEYNLLRGSSSTDNVARALSPTFANDQSARIQLAESSANFVSTGPMVRIQSATDASGYIAAIQSTTSIKIQRVTDNGSTISYADLLGAITVSTLNVGDTVTLGVVGTTLTLYVNGVPQGTTRDTGGIFTTGQPGVWFFNTIGIAENFYATDL